LISGENKPSRVKNNFTQFLSFSIASAETPGKVLLFHIDDYVPTNLNCNISFPPKGLPTGRKERNKKLGASWQLLTADQKNVFDARVFAFFSKLPINLRNHTTNINGNSNCDDDDDETLDEPLTTEEKELYKPLYEDLVNHEKVELVLAQGPTQDSAIPPQALRQVTRLNEKVKYTFTSNNHQKYTDYQLLLQLFTLANSYNLTFYSLAATRSPGAGSFCKEFSNDASWLNVTKNKWNVKQTFEAYSHGRAIQEIVEEISPDGEPPAKKEKKANRIRRTLRIELNQLLGRSFSSSDLLSYTLG
jgi:hypothetical protein